MHDDLPAGGEDRIEMRRELDLLAARRGARSCTRLHADRLAVADAEDVDDSEEVLPDPSPLIPVLDDLDEIAAVAHLLQRPRRRAVALHASS